MTTRFTDLSYLERLYKGDRSRIAQWIRLYLEEAPCTFTQLSECQQRGDDAGLAAAAHDLRPYAHYLGAPRMLELLIDVGQRVRSTGAASTADLVHEVLVLGQCAERELRAVIAGEADAEKPV